MNVCLPDDKYQDEETEHAGENQVEAPLIVTQIPRTNGIYEIVVSSCSLRKDFENILQSPDLQLNKNIYLIKFLFVKKIVKLELPDIRDLATKLENKSILITLNATVEGSFEVLWKLNKSKNFLSFKLNKKLKIDEKIALEQFIVNFLLESLKINHLGKFH